MSGLVGVLRVDGSPVAAAALEAMAAVLSHRRPDGSGTWIEGRVGLGRLLHRTSGSTDGTADPVVDPSGRVVLTLDGRIDDRASLRSDLGGDRDRLRDGSDPELLLQAYLRWGSAALGRVVGEFAVAVWDGRRDELVLARDFLGKRPLLYHQSSTQVRWASEVQAVLADPAVSRAIDVAMVGERLSQSPQSRTATLYEAVRRVPPAHALVISASGVRLERHWAWDPEAPPVRRADDQAHVRAFVEVFARAVESALDTAGPVAAELSGGMDSSSVVAVADEAIRAGRARGPLHLLSLVFPGQPHDESAQIRSVASHRGLHVDELVPTVAGAPHYLHQVEQLLDLPEPPNMAMHRDLHRRARDHGAKVLLTGKGGDEWLTGSALAYADALRGLRLREAWRTARTDRQVWRSRGWLHQLGRDGIGPLLPDRAQRALAGARGPALPSWLPARFWEAHGLTERIRSLPVRGRSLATAATAAWLEDATLLLSTESSERTLSLAGLEARSALDDRRVVELALGLPERVRRQGAATKWVLRVGMSGLLPDDVRTRVDKANFVPIFHDELAAQGGAALFRDLAIEDLGWVDGRAVRALWDELEAGHRSGAAHPHVWTLWTILSTERFARARV